MSKSRFRISNEKISQKSRFRISNAVSEFPTAFPNFLFPNFQHPCTKKKSSWLATLVIEIKNSKLHFHLTLIYVQAAFINHRVAFKTLTFETARIIDTCGICTNFKRFMMSSYTQRWNQILIKFYHFLGFHQNIHLCRCNFVQGSTFVGFCVSWKAWSQQYINFYVVKKY